MEKKEIRFIVEGYYTGEHHDCFSFETLETAEVCAEHCLDEQKYQRVDVVKEVHVRKRLAMHQR